jgi:V/A-type H+/Na+-transporting ATPase subunit K
MKKRIVFTLLLLIIIAIPAIAQTDTAAAAGTSSWIKYVAAAMAVGLATIGGGIAVGQIGAAAMAAMSENPELSGRALPYVGLAEGVCLWGFIVGLMILFS